MRANIETWLLRHWYTKDKPPWYLRALEHGYKAGFKHSQNKSNPAARDVSRAPLVIVGNITVGGSGKTPLVIRLAQIALDMQLKPGIASTGYGRASKETLAVGPNSNARTCGDEPVMLAARTGVPVVVARDRFEAIRTLQKMDLDLIISDDGLQRAGLTGDIEFCVIDGERGLGNGHLLPAGPLREPATRLALVDHVVSNGEWKDKPDDIQVTVMSLQANVVRSLDGTFEYAVNDFLKKVSGSEVHAVAGIGNPERFFMMLKNFGFKLKKCAFPDHHAFQRHDFESIKDGSAIIMTEKDAVKCSSLGLKNAWYVPVDTHLPAEFERGLRSQLSRLTKVK